MKSLEKQRSKMESRRIYFLKNHKTAISSPIQSKYIMKGVFISSKKQTNPYQKKFTIRKVAKTQQSKQVQQKSLQRPRKSSQRFRPNYPKVLLGNEISQKLTSLNQTLNLKSRPHNITTQMSQIRQRNNNQSPYLKKIRMKTLQTYAQKKGKNYLQQQKLFHKQSKYSYLTKFQQDQLQNYQVYYTGQRRIMSIKQFTDLQGNAKIAQADAIIYRYQIQDTLGQGSFGQVFKAYDHRKKQQVALKIIKNHPKFNKQARVEIKILQKVLQKDPLCQHNIIKLKHAFFFRGHACLTFQLLHINLYQFLRLHSFSGLSISLIHRFSIQLLQSLCFFSKHEIIHCDLKPQNILLKQQNKTGIKIIDVGSGCFEGTQVYTYIQSRFYRAPEVVIGMKYTKAIDVWSFACVICQLYLGKPIFPGEDQTQQIMMFMEVFGVPPEQLIDQGSRSNKFFDQYRPRTLPNSRGKVRIPNSKSLRTKLKNCKNQKFLTFLQKCFKWSPQQRLKPHQALLDQWILQGLPQQLREQHISIVKQDFLPLI